MRHLIRIFNQGGLSAISEHWTPDIVWHTDPRGARTRPSTRVGAEVSAYLQGWIGAFGDSLPSPRSTRSSTSAKTTSCSSLPPTAIPSGDTVQETQFIDWTFINTFH